MRPVVSRFCRSRQSLAKVLACLAVFCFALAGLPARLGAAENERVAAELRAMIEGGAPAIGNEDRDERVVEVYVFYAADRNFKPLWVRDGGPKAKAGEVLKLFEAAADFGLDPARYRVGEIAPRMGAKEPHDLAELELLLTRAFIDFGRDLNRGRVAPSEASPENAITARELGPLMLIDGAEAADSIADFVKTLEPQTPQYARLKAALATYRGIAKAGGWPAIPKGPALKPGGQDPRIPAIRRRLRITGDLSADAADKGGYYDPDLVAAVKWFQYRHGLAEDGVIAGNTLAEMNVPVIERVRQIELNLERRRWMDDDLGPFYIFVNIADQALKVVKDDKTVHTARLVVGGPYARTPVFSDRMKYIVLNPTWNVPQAIADREFLPKLRKNPGVLKTQAIRIFAGQGDAAREIDPASVDWTSLKRMPYALRQDAGAKNALGRVKFMFPNRFNVYLHDTPAKSLFAKDLRVFSHGCMRIEDPLALAALLLEPQGWTRAKIDEAIAADRQRVINLARPIPIHVTYLTAWANKDGSVHFRRDPYGRDRQLEAALAGAPAPE